MRFKNAILGVLLVMGFTSIGIFIGQMGFFGSEKIVAEENSIKDSKSDLAVVVDEAGKVVATIDPSVTKSVLALNQGDKSNVIDPRNNQPVSPNVITFLDALNENNAYAVSGALTEAKDIQKLYIDLWEGAKAGGITLRNIISEKERAAGVSDTEPNPGTVLAIYDSTSDLEYCAVDQTYYGMKRSSLNLYYQLLVPLSCAEFAKS